MKRVLGNVRLKDVTSRKIRAYQGTCGAGVSNRTVNLEIKLLRGILKHEGQWAGIQPDYKPLRESGESPGRALMPDESLRLSTTAETRTDGWWHIGTRSLQTTAE